MGPVSAGRPANTIGRRAGSGGIGRMSLANAIGRTASPGGHAGGRLSARSFTDRGRPPAAPNEHCPKRPVLLAIGAPVRQCRLDPVGPLEVGEHEGRGEARRGERGRAPQGVRGARPPSRRISYREPSLARLGTRAAPRPPSPAVRWRNLASTAPLDELIAHDRSPSRALQEFLGLGPTIPRDLEIRGSTARRRRFTYQPAGIRHRSLPLCAHVCEEVEQRVLASSMYSRMCRTRERCTLTR
jgi:hypothetical protein